MHQPRLWRLPFVSWEGLSSTEARPRPPSPIDHYQVPRLSGITGSLALLLDTQRPLQWPADDRR